MQNTLKRKPDYFSSEFHDGIDIVGNIEDALFTASTIFSLLDTEIAKIQNGRFTKIITAIGGVKYVLNEATLSNLGRQLQDVWASINFLQNTLQRQPPSHHISNIICYKECWNANVRQRACY
jgi:hypothetical protein